MNEQYTPEQLVTLKKIHSTVTQFHARNISLGDLCAVLNDGIRSMDLSDKKLLGELLDIWTSLEIVSTLGTVDRSLKQVSADCERLHTILNPIVKGA